MKLITLLVFVMSLNAQAYFPSLESLLRNPNNVDIGSNTVVANLVITPIDKDTNQPLLNEDGTADRFATKLIVYNKNEDRPRLIQVDYQGGKVSKSLLVNHTDRPFKNLSSLVRNPEAVEAKFFYATMAMLLNNDGSQLIELLKTVNSDVKTNTEHINRMKLKLLGDYKRYLTILKKDKKSTIENPLRPESPEKREKVKAIMSQSFLSKDSLVKREKKRENFIWKVDTDSLKAQFDHDHRLQNLWVKTKLGEMSLVMGRSLVFGSQFEFPEFIWMTDLTGKKYEIKASKIQFFQDNPKWHQSRLERYSEQKLENKISDPPKKPPFIL